MEYINAQPAGIRMGQGMQRVWNSHLALPHRGQRWPPWLATSAWRAAARATPAALRPFARPPASPSRRSTTPTGPIRAPTRSNLVKSSTLYEQIEQRRPVPHRLHVVRQLELHQHEPRLPTRIIERGAAQHLDHRHGRPLLDRGRRRYSDYVLPACNYWEKWDFLDRSPWVFFPAALRCRRPARARPTSRSCRLLAARRWASGDLWSKTDEEWVRSFVNEEHPAWEGFDFDEAVKEGIWGRPDGIYDERHRLRRRRVPHASQR